MVKRGLWFLLAPVLLAFLLALAASIARGAETQPILMSAVFMLPDEPAIRFGDVLTMETTIQNAGSAPAVAHAEGYWSKGLSLISAPDWKVMSRTLVFERELAPGEKVVLRSEFEVYVLDGTVTMRSASFAHVTDPNVWEPVQEGRLDVTVEAEHKMYLPEAEKHDAQYSH